MERMVPALGEARTQPASHPVQEEQPASAEAPPAPLAVDSDSEETTAPWAAGACQLDLSREEWRLVRDAPLLSFLMVAARDGQVDAGERRTLLGALKDGQRSSSKALRMACGELFRHRDALLETFVATELRLERLTEAYRLLDQKLGREEAERFKEGLLQLGRRVVSGSGSLLASWGWFSSAERGALAELAVRLDAGRA